MCRSAAFGERRVEAAPAGAAVSCEAREPHVRHAMSKLNVDRAADVVRLLAQPGV
jgi:hypothetical protein